MGVSLGLGASFFGGMLGLLSAFTAAQASAQMSTVQAELLAVNCMQCHVREGIGVPLLGDTAHWDEVAKQGEDAILINVVQGKGGMPPLGYCSACDESDFRAMIRFMTGLPGSTEANKGKQEIEAGVERDVLGDPK